MTTIRTRCARGAAALVLPLVLGACGGHGGTPPPRPRPAVVIVAEDISGSAFDRNVRNVSRTPVVLERALQLASDTGGKVFVVAVTSDTAGMRQLPVSGSDADFSATPQWATTNLLREQWKAQLRRAAITRYKAWRAKATRVYGSDYVGLFLILDDLLAGAGNSDTQVWIVGDGFQNTKDWKLEPPSRALDPAACRAKVQQFHAAGDLGLLHGAKVLFDGGGIRDDRGTVRQQAVLRGCWEDLIRTAGGSTPPGWWEGA